MGCNSSRAENPQKTEQKIEDLVSHNSNLANYAKVNSVHTPKGSKSFAVQQNNQKAIHSPSFTSIAEQVSRKQSILSSQSESETDTPGKLSKLNSLEHFRKKTQEAKSYLQKFLKRAAYLEGIMEKISKSPKGAFNSSVFEAPLAENTPEEKQTTSSDDLVLILEDLTEINSAVNILSQKFTTINTGISKLLIKDDNRHSEKEAQKEEIDQEIKKCESVTDTKEDYLHKENAENNENNETEEKENLKVVNEEPIIVSSILSDLIASPPDVQIVCQEVNVINEDAVEKNELNEEIVHEQGRPSENISIDSAPEMINKSRVIATKLFNVTTKQPGKSKIGARPKLEVDSLAPSKPHIQPIITPKRNSDIGSKLPQFFSPSSKPFDEPKKFQIAKAYPQISQVRIRSSQDSLNLNAFDALKKQVEAEIDPQKPKSRIQKMSFGNNHPRSLSTRSNN
ncbi:unnamed protein product [Blepharisma stoltei]|uniref:Uncharacterized protein n=1 Tax=Blepharisma stoltei TaxID=1481888 RepID=A0AAU9JW45_9CILI|nr:unnamed protein product [Blepharisma stoltei]